MIVITHGSVNEMKEATGVKRLGLTPVYLADVDMFMDYKLILDVGKKLKRLTVTTSVETDDFGKKLVFTYTNPGVKGRMELYGLSSEYCEAMKKIPTAQLLCNIEA